MKIVKPLPTYKLSGADTGGVDRVDIHPPPHFSVKKIIRNVTLFEIENK